MKINRFILVLFSAVLITLASCQKDDPAPVTISASTVTNLPADPPSGGYDPMSGQPIGVTKKFTLFSFKTGAIVANADSATANWDLGFNGTTIIVNSGTSGPGTAGAQVVTGVFDEILEAPASGYGTDNKTTVPATYAIPRGSGNGWYNYNPSTNVISPIAGRVIVVKTSEGKYAKMEILSYYKDSPAAPSSGDIDRHYTFRYVYQSGASSTFE
ncbi:MAG: HmuY family protein [Cyclobacteriaceae bacterium]|nr:HmuY family protein [Cyclobacteriaceae bacterium]